ncbi:MAG: CopG family transcriptional regulator [Deltaproteobacteria bacterium]|nr:MAG: CopG family transcriptional regulator [Deltaproteobacteria bacterium]
MKTATMTVRMEVETRERLSRLAKVVNRSKSFILDQAIREYLAVHEWQIREIDKAVAFADSSAAKWTEHETVKAKWENKLAH